MRFIFVATTANEEIAIEARHETNVVRRILESHGISDEAYDALKKNDASGFIEGRAKYIEEIERDFMKKLGVTPPETTGGGETDIDIEE